MLEPVAAPLAARPRRSPRRKLRHTSCKLPTTRSRCTAAPGQPSKTHPPRERTGEKSERRKRRALSQHTYAYRYAKRRPRRPTRTYTHDTCRSTAWDGERRTRHAWATLTHATHATQTRHKDARTSPAHARHSTHPQGHAPHATRGCATPLTPRQSAPPCRRRCSPPFSSWRRRRWRRGSR